MKSRQCNISSDRVERSVLRQPMGGTPSVEVWIGNHRCGYRVEKGTMDHLTVVPRTVTGGRVSEDTQDCIDAIRLYARAHYSK